MIFKQVKQYKSFLLVRLYLVSLFNLMKRERFECQRHKPGKSLDPERLLSFFTNELEDQGNR